MSKWMVEKWNQSVRHGQEVFLFIHCCHVVPFSGCCVLFVGVPFVHCFYTSISFSRLCFILFVLLISKQFRFDFLSIKKCFGTHTHMKYTESIWKLRCLRARIFVIYWSNDQHNWWERMSFSILITRSRILNYTNISTRLPIHFVWQMPKFRFSKTKLLLFLLHHLNFNAHTTNNTLQCQMRKLKRKSQSSMYDLCVYYECFCGIRSSASKFAKFKVYTRRKVLRKNFSRP